MHELALVTAFMAGLLGSTHCLTMCGGIASALGATRAPGAHRGYPLLYQCGRLTSYAAAGGLAGALGLAAGAGFALARWGQVLRLATAVVVVLIGLDLALGSGRRPRLLRLPERAGAQLWRRLLPIVTRVLPARLRARPALGLAAVRPGLFRAGRGGGRRQCGSGQRRDAWLWAGYAAGDAGPELCGRATGLARRHGRTAVRRRDRRLRTVVRHDADRDAARAARLARSCRCGHGADARNVRPLAQADVPDLGVTRAAGRSGDVEDHDVGPRLVVLVQRILLARG